MAQLSYSGTAIHAFAPPIASFNKLSNGASHMQINTAISEIQRLEYSAIARACTEIVVKCVNVYWFTKLVSRLFSEQSDEQRCRWKLLIETTLQQRFIIYHNVRFFTFSSPHMRGEEWRCGVHVGVVGKPIPDFLIHVHWSHYNISSGHLTIRPNIANKRDFRRRGHFGDA